MSLSVVLSDSLDCTPSADDPNTYEFFIGNDQKFVAVPVHEHYELWRVLPDGKRTRFIGTFYELRNAQICADLLAFG